MEDYGGAIFANSNYSDFLECHATNALHTCGAIPAIDLYKYCVDESHRNNWWCHSLLIKILRISSCQMIHSDVKFKFSYKCLSFVWHFVQIGLQGASRAEWEKHGSWAAWSFRWHVESADCFVLDVPYRVLDAKKAHPASYVVRTTLPMLPWQVFARLYSGKAFHSPKSITNIFLSLCFQCLHPAHHIFSYCEASLRIISFLICTLF